MIKFRTLAIWILLIADIGYSAYQHYHMPIGGDMAEVVMPSPGNGYYQVLQDPFGLNVLVKNESYPNPNRFFAHWSASAYFLNIPLLLQNFTDPIGSIYLAIAIAKTMIQLLIIYLLAVYISNKTKISDHRFLLAALLVTPFFQAAGFCRTLGIIDQSVIYTFFYALPLGLLMLFFLPFYRALFFNKKIKYGTARIVLLALLVIFLSLNGPLIPGVVLIICPLILLILWINNYRDSGVMKPSIKKISLSVKKIPGLMLIMFLFFSLLSLYSLYIGRNNSLSLDESIPMLDRYLKIPEGLYNLLTKKIAFPLLLSSIIINAMIIRFHYKNEEGYKIVRLCRWIGIFSIIYILLLPFGGYRGYRENIVRYDTIMPVTLALVYLFGLTSRFLVENIALKFRTVYLTGIAAVLIIFTVADQLKPGPYECERQAIMEIAASDENPVSLDSDCPVMDWRKINDPQASTSNVELFQYWYVLDRKKLYYHE